MDTSRSLRLCHLSFADDLLLFSRGDHFSMKVLMRAMKTFELASGLAVNQDKSEIYMNVVGSADKSKILQTSGFVAGVFPFKYLGIPISYKRLSVGDCNKLVERIVARIRSWGARKLSYTGHHEFKSPQVSWEHCCNNKKNGSLRFLNYVEWNK
ncbi:uncharacterized protein LOC141640796 [Silene latifolia]|uniref:uncharacterized protein LOC141640796 n=1 Tax=Silene latifolia TaxID=37657 RepID=UPI003D76B895